MKVSEILQEKAGLSKVGAWPNAFLNRVYKVFNLDSKDLPETESKKPTLKDLEKKIYISIGDDGSYAALGVWKSGGFSATKGPRIVVFKDGKATDASLDKMSDAMKQFPRGTYFSLQYADGSFYTTRAKRDVDVSSDRTRETAGDVMTYMNDFFLPRLKEKAEKTISRVYSNLRKVSGEKNTMWSYAKSDQEHMLAAVQALEKMLKSGFTRELMDEFLRRHDKLSHGWGSIPNNYYNFAQMMQKPAAKAEFAKVVLTAINNLDKELNKALGLKEDDMKVSEILEEGIIDDAIASVFNRVAKWLYVRAEKKKRRAAILDKANQEQIEKMFDDMEKFSKSLLSTQRRTLLSYIKDGRESLRYVQNFDHHTNKNNARFENEIKYVEDALVGLDRLAKSFAKNKKVQLKRGPNAPV